MRINITSKDGITLKTKDKFIREDISVGLTDEDIAKLAPENIVEGVEILGVEGTYKASGGASKSLKGFLDAKKSAERLFSNFSTMTNDQLAEFIPTYDTTENVTNMNMMFNSCNSLTEIPLFDTSKVTNMEQMFSSCSKLTTIPLFDTSSVTTMKNMFAGCSKFETFPQLDTSKVNDMTQMFGSCEGLTEISLFDTSSVTNMSYTFTGCRSLLSVSTLDTSKVNNMIYMFFNCNKLSKIDITYFNIGSSYNTSGWCNYCYSLKALIIRSFGTNYTLNSNPFSGCYHILGTVDAQYNPNGDKDGYFYIPREYIEILSSATNWSSYADRLRALEDYTKDGTTTGEFDDEKAGLL